MRSCGFGHVDGDAVGTPDNTRSSGKVDRRNSKGHPRSKVLYLRFLTNSALSAAFDGLGGLAGLRGRAASPRGLPLAVAFLFDTPTGTRSLGLVPATVTGFLG